MFPASTKSGGAIASFPDVCKTPTPAGPIPVAYPNVAMQAQGQKGPKKISGKGQVGTKGTAFSMSAGNAPGTLGGVKSAKNTSVVKIRGRMVELHNRLMTMQGNNPNTWHELLDEYVMATAEVYITLASD